MENMELEANKAKARNVVRLCDQMKSQRTNWSKTWEEVLKNFAPQRNRVYNHTKGDVRGERLYDSTPQHFVELLASALHSMLTNPAVQWFGLGTGDTTIDRKTANQKYLQKLVSLVHDSLNATNFQTEIHEFYLDIVTLGTACMFIEKDPDTILRFTTMPIFELGIKENSKGEVKTVSRTIKMTLEQAIEKYGEEAFQGKNQNLKPDHELEIIHLVMPRDNAKAEKLDTLNKKYASYHVWEEEKILLKESGYDEFPYVVARWSKLGNETHGRSPAMKTLPDARMLQQMMKTIIRGAQKAVDPPYIMEHDSVLGRLNLTAGGVTAAKHGMIDGIKTLPSGGDIGLGIDMVGLVKMNMKQGFFIDQLQLGGSDRMTELEVNIRNDENLRLLSPILGRLHNELLDPLVGRIIKLMMEAKKLPTNTPLDLQQNQLKMHYRSQIAKAQTSNEGRALTGFIAEISGLAAELQKPEILDVINMDEVIKVKATLESIPMGIFHDVEDSDALRDTRAQANADNQNLQKQNLEADTLQKANKAQK